MFNIGIPELGVLAVIGLIVLGPERLPGLAKDAARMIRTLRELANGARVQLQEELGPEFADLDLRSLNPRTAIQRALLGDDDQPAVGATIEDKAVTMPTMPTRPPVQAPLASNEDVPFDADAT
jgi:sec-independent protein translocase protein TatB